MKSYGKLTMAALMLAGSAIGATSVTSTPAAAQVSIGVGIGGPGYYRGGYYRGGYAGRCANERFRYYHAGRCGRGYAPVVYGPAYYGYYDTGYYGAGYYEPAATGFWFTDSGGHRRHHDGHFNGGGFHGHARYHH